MQGKTCLNIRLVKNAKIARLLADVGNVWKLIEDMMGYT